MLRASPLITALVPAVAASADSHDPDGWAP